MAQSTDEIDYKVKLGGTGCEDLTSVACHPRPDVRSTSYHAEDEEKHPDFTTAAAIMAAGPGDGSGSKAQSSRPISIISARHKFAQLSWQRLTSCLICEAIALGALGMPKAFATLGMAYGIIFTVAIGLLATHCSLLLAKACLKLPHLKDYAEMMGYLFGKRGYWIAATMLVVCLTLSTASHVLTGVIAFNALSSNATCSVTFSLVAAFLLFVLALPRTFTEMALLAYIDFASILAAIVVTLVTCGIEASKQPGGLQATEWYWFLPKERRSDWPQVIVAITNIVFAFAFAQCLPSFMSELRKPDDVSKSLWTLGGLEIVLYTVIGSTAYYFKGHLVESPTILSINPTMEKVAFGLALPVIFISGSINTQTAARFLYDRIFGNSKHRFMDTAQGKIAWVALGLFITIIAWIIAESIPVFESLLAIVASLLITAFCYAFPTLMYFGVLKQGKWNESWANVGGTFVHVAILALAICTVVGGCTASIMNLLREFRRGVGRPFSC